MQRITIRRPGGHDRLELEHAPDLSPSEGEVVIQVRASGINFADCITRMGLYASARQLVGYPITPGFEVAGTVAAVGAGVSDIYVGMPVLALTLFGGYATQVRVPANQVFSLPAGWSFAQAAAFPTAFLTAWFGLVELARARRGARVLVHSAAGGVGGAAVQLARELGCEVVGVVGASHKVEAVQRAGAQAVVDKSTQTLWPQAERLAPQGFDVVLDANGAETLRQSYLHLVSGGRLVVYGFHTMFRRGGGKAPWPKLIWSWLRTPRFDPLRLTQENRSVMGFNLSFLGDRAGLLRPAMEELLDMASRGRIAPPPVTIYPFRSVADAHRDLESARTVGKLVLTMD